MIVKAMFLDDDKKNFFFSQLSQFEVVDKDSKKIGKPGDALFTKELNFNSLILFGGLLEEKMEALHLRENIDPIVPISDIDSIDYKKGIIRLNKTKNDLNKMDKNFPVPDGLIQYTKLKKLAIYEKNNVKIGRVIDILFKARGGYSFIVGGSGLEEFLEKIRIIPDNDLIVPSSSVVDISNKIKINENKDELITTLFENVNNPINYLENKKSEFVPKKPPSIRHDVLIKQELILQYHLDLHPSGVLNSHSFDA